MLKALWISYTILMSGSLAMAAGISHDLVAQPQDTLTTTQDGAIGGGIGEGQRARRTQVCQREYESCVESCKSSKDYIWCKVGCYAQLKRCASNVSDANQD